MSRNCVKTFSISFVENECAALHSILRSFLQLDLIQCAICALCAKCGTTYHNITDDAQHHYGNAQHHRRGPNVCGYLHEIGGMIAGTTGAIGDARPSVAATAPNTAAIQLILLHEMEIVIRG